MAQLDFYLNEKDKAELASFIFSEGGYLIPNINYEKPEYFELKVLEDYIPYSSQNIVLFIAHNDFFKSSLTWESFTKDGKKLYYMPQRYGGPTVDLYSPGLIIRDGVKFIGPGNISFYSTYYDSLDSKKVEAPAELKFFYKMLTAYIKKFSCPLKIYKRTYRVGLNAVKELKAGSKLVNAEDDVVAEFLKVIE
jgi:hypothetical protein